MSASEDEHAFLIKNLQADDEIVFEEIYHLYKKPLFQIALRYLKEKELAEDALQDVFIKLWNCRHQLTTDSSLRGWLHTSLKHHILNVIRTEQNRIRIAVQAASTNPGYSNLTEQELNYRESKKLIVNGIKTLSEGKRKIFILSVMEGYSNREIASMLNISEHTVRSQISHSNRILRQYLNRVISLLIALIFLS